MFANDDKVPITPIGVTNWRNTNTPFGIKAKDRLAHMYVIGKTGVGKSTLLLNMAIADMEQGNGIGVIDPHGDLAQELLQHIPAYRKEDVIYFNAADTDAPVAFNPLYNIPKEEHHIVTSELIATFKKIWADSWGPRLEYILRYCLQTLLQYPHATLLYIQPLLTDILFRREVLAGITDTHIASFWLNEFEKYPVALKAEAISPILNKTGLFISHTILRNIIGSPTSSFSLQTILDTKKIFIVNLSKGQIGEDASALLGSMLVSAIGLAAMRRAKQPIEQRVPFYLFIDEMHSFISLSFVDILAEARKYGLGLFLAHQYIEQLHEKIRAAIFGNVGTIISFRVGATDAAYLAQEFYPVFTQDDLINLPKYSMYLKLMIDGATSKPFSADTLPLLAPINSSQEEIITYSRKRYVKLLKDITTELPQGHEKHPVSEGTGNRLFPL